MNHYGVMLVLWNIASLDYHAGKKGNLKISFKECHVPNDMILMVGRWMLAYPLSYSNNEGFMEERVQI